MYEIGFSVDTSIWQDGITFQEKVAPADTQSPSFSEVLATVAPVAQVREVPLKSAPDAAKAETTAAAMSPVVLPTFNQQTVQELPAALSDVQDLTPFVVSADSKPGARLDGELKRTSFSETAEKMSRSPYNMSEARAKRREAALAAGEARPLKGISDEKLFPMTTAARYTARSAAPAFTSAPADAQRKESASKLTQSDVSAIMAQAGQNENYPREPMPSFSNEKTSAAAAWFPEAMTKQLDKYEAMNKVAAQTATKQGAGAPVSAVDFNA